MNEPQSFNNQREAYWYRQGIKDALESVTNTLKMDLIRYDLETVDHLPEGEDDIEGELPEGMGKSCISSQLVYIRKFGIKKQKQHRQEQ